MNKNSKTIEFPCGKCKKEVFSDAIECSVCLKWFHRRCTNLTKTQLKHIKTNDQWYCLFCSQIFPFHEIDDDEFFILNSTIDININLASIYKESLDFSFKPFNFTEYSSSDLQNEIDPDNNFF